MRAFIHHREVERAELMEELTRTGSPNVPEQTETALKHTEAELDAVLGFLTLARTPDEAFEARNKILETAHRDRGNTNALRGYISCEDQSEKVEDSENSDEVVIKLDNFDVSILNYEPNLQAGD